MSHWDAPASFPDGVPPTSGSSRKTLRIVLGVVGGLLVLMILGCAGLIYWGMGMYREVGPVQVAAEEFLDRLASGQIAEARSIAAPAFQASVDEPGLRAVVEKVPALTTSEHRSLAGLRVYATPAGVRGTAQFQLSGGKNSALVSLILVKIDDRWRVETLRIP